MSRNVRKSTFYHALKWYSNQPAHQRSMSSVFIVHKKKLCILGYPSSAYWRFWLSKCVGRSESSLGAHVFWYVFFFFFFFFPVFWRCCLNVFLHMMLVFIKEVSHRRKKYKKKSMVKNIPYQELWLRTLDLHRIVHIVTACEYLITASIWAFVIKICDIIIHSAANN